LFDAVQLDGLIVDRFLQRANLVLKPVNLSLQLATVVISAIAEKENDQGNENQGSAAKAHRTAFDDG